MNGHHFDVLVIGSGIAGLSSAIKLAEEGIKVGILTRQKDPHISNTYYAQGGIIYSQENDAKLCADIQRASSQTSGEMAIKVLTQNSAKIIEDVLLNKVQTDFERDSEGQLKKTKEGAHSFPRIIYKGDYTGKAIQISLLNYLNDTKRFPNVTILAGHTAIDLLTAEHHGITLQQRYEENKVLGAYVLNQDTGDVIKVLAKNTILATGGIGYLYLHHSNSEGSRGDGHAMAKRAGALLTNMEFVQFHPTTFHDQSAHRRFLISEAVRGEGGILINSDGSSFMEKYHPERELAPRDIVSRAIVEETIDTGHACVYLDISHKKSDWIKTRFPTIYEYCKQHNLDISKDPIPVVPAAHYSCGGIKADSNGRTTLNQLYAVGEVACTGLHGANRLAGTALLEGLTWGHLAAADIIKHIDGQTIYPQDDLKPWEISGKSEVDSALIQQDWLTLKQTMWNYVGLIRTRARLARASAMFSELYDEIQKFYKNTVIDDELIGLRNAVEVSYSVLTASCRNKTSIGCFYRKD